MSNLQSTDRAHAPLGKRGAFEEVARRHGRRRNPARTTPRSQLRTPTNPPRRPTQRWVEKCGRSIKGSETPQQHDSRGTQQFGRERASTSGAPRCSLKAPSGDDGYASGRLGLPGRCWGLTDRTLLVSGDAWARACASVTVACGRAPERRTHTRTATSTTSRSRASATASITGSDISPVVRFQPCLPIPAANPSRQLYHDDRPAAYDE